ncbi:MAG: hypothetical protein H8D23_29520 [Candidatus Brocadiales bacterium]|nr:hypothetical protein [Candidatus Brocadiales bacterium]
MKQSKRDNNLLSLWRDRPVEQQTSNDVMAFYSHIQKNFPDLFHGIKGDPYQYLKGMLSDCFHDKQ